MEPTATIRNRRTGEVKQIPQSQLASYVPNTQPSTQPPSQPGGGFASWLPLIGALGGSFIPGLGPILGGALGAAGGTIGKQAIQGKPDIGEVGKEAAFAGFGGVLGKGLGGLVGRIFGRGGPAIAEAGTKGGISAGLASRTLASNFRIPPKLAPQIKIEEALGQMIDDEVKLPLSLKGYQDIAGKITGDKGAITQAYRDAALNVKAPINFDTALVNAQNSVGLKGAIPFNEQKGVLAKIRNYFNNRDYPTPGTISSDDAFDIARQLEKEGYNLYHRGINELTPRPDLEAIGQTYIGVADDLLNQISRGIDTEGLFPIVRQNAITQLQKVSPKLAARAGATQNISQLRSVAAPYVNISRGVQATLNRGETPFGMGSLALTSRIVGALGGGGLFGLPGAAAGAALAPSVQGIAAASEPALTSLAARGILGAGKAVGKLGGPETLTRAGVAGGATLGGEPVVPEAQAAEPGQQNIEEQLLPPQSENQLQEKLRQAFFLAMLSNPKQAAQLQTIFNFGFPKPPAGTADREASLKVGEQAVNEALRSTTKGYGPVGGGISSKLLQSFGGAGVPTDVIQANTRYQLLRQSVVRALQGARMSDVDIKLALQYVPQITDTENTAKQKLTILKNFLTQTRQYLKRVPGQSEETNPIPLPQGGF